MESYNGSKRSVLQPERMQIALFELGFLGIDPIEQDSTTITFEWKGHPVKFYPYTGWHTGKTIKDGRGLQNLLNQLK